MIYESLEKIPATKYNDPECENNKILLTIIERIAEESKNKKYIVGGGISLAISFGKLIRCHKDLDLYILKEDLNFWKDFFQKFNLTTKNNSWNDNYYVFDKNNYKLIDLMFKIPNFEGKVLDDVPTLNKYNVMVLDPEIVKIQKLDIFPERALKRIKKEKIDFKNYFNEDYVISKKY